MIRERHGFGSLSLAVCELEVLGSSPLVWQGEGGEGSAPQPWDSPNPPQARNKVDKLRRELLPGPFLATVGN